MKLSHSAYTSIGTEGTCGFEALMISPFNRVVLLVLCELVTIMIINMKVIRLRR